jgi:hypothetical protein
VCVLLPGDDLLVGVVHSVVVTQHLSNHDMKYRENTRDRSAIPGLLLPQMIDPSGSIISAATVHGCYCPQLMSTHPALVMSSNGAIVAMMSSNGAIVAMVSSNGAIVANLSMQS